MAAGGTLETERLVLRPMVAADVEALLGIFGDAAAMAGDRLIGDCGLEVMEVSGQQVVELGYDFRSDHWNRGYATEAACAVRDYAFGTLRLPLLVSLIRPRNRASARVAEKVGLEKVGEVERDGRTYLRYELQNPCGDVSG